MKKLRSALLALLMMLSLAMPAAAEELAVDAQACLLMEKTTGQVLYAVNEHEQLEPASVTKVMTLLLVMEAIDSGALSYDDMVTASAYACSMGGSQIWLEENEQKWRSQAEILGQAGLLPQGQQLFAKFHSGKLLSCSCHQHTQAARQAQASTLGNLSTGGNIRAAESTQKKCRPDARHFAKLARKSALSKLQELGAAPAKHPVISSLST